jgi:hypothetical protein
MEYSNSGKPKTLSKFATAYHGDNPASKLNPRTQFSQRILKKVVGEERA